jgi:hypothetical protein
MAPHRIALLWPPVFVSDAGALASSNRYWAKEISMSRTLSRNLKPRRIAALGAALMLAIALSGCVIYPVGPGYYHPFYFHDHDRGWH